MVQFFCLSVQLLV